MVESIVPHSALLLPKPRLELKKGYRVQLLQAVGRDIQSRAVECKSAL